LKNEYFLTGKGTVPQTVDGGATGYQSTCHTVNLSLTNYLVVELRQGLGLVLDLVFCGYVSACIMSVVIVFSEICWLLVDLVRWWLFWGNAVHLWYCL